MILLGPLVLVGIIVAIVLAVQRGTGHHDPAPLPGSSRPTLLRDDAPRAGRTRRPAALSDMLDRWVAEGLLTADQANAIIEHERPAVAVPAPRRTAPAPVPGRRVPAYAEALGYLGGVLALAGLTLLVANYWPDMSTSIRLALSLVTTIVLVGAGALVHEHIDPALARLRWFLWTLASATAAVFTGVLMIATLEVDTAAFVVAACAATVALTSGLLWWGHDRPVQEFLVLGGTIVSAATFVGAMTNSGFAGLTAWVLATIVLAVGLRGLTPQPMIPHVVGAVAVMVGAFVTVSTWMGAGALFVLATAGGLLLLAALPQLTMDVLQRIVLIVVGTFGALQAIPMTLGYFASEAGGATGLATWAVGARPDGCRRPAVAAGADRRRGDRWPGIDRWGGADRHVVGELRTPVRARDRRHPAGDRDAARPGDLLPARLARSADQRAVGDQHVLPRRGASTVADPGVGRGDRGRGRAARSSG